MHPSNNCQFKDHSDLVDITTYCNIAMYIWISAITMYHQDWNDDITSGTLCLTSFIKTFSPRLWLQVIRTD